MALIRQLKSFLAKTNIYPKTLTSAVYDNEGNRLDNKLGAASLSGYADGTITGAVKSACDDVETLKSDVNQINSNLIILKRDSRFCLTFNNITKVVNLSGLGYFTIAAWGWLFPFQDINEKYKPPTTFVLENGLVLEDTGVLKTQDDISNKLVNINLSWNVNE